MADYDETIRRLQAAGRSDSEIAAAIGRCHETVRKARQRLGLPSGHPAGRRREAITARRLPQAVRHG